MPDGTEAVADDLVLLLQACGLAVGDRVLAEVRSAVGDDIRFNDGYVFQHLIPGPCSVTSLAERLGVSQQAASKQVADLERRRLVVRRRDPGDARARLVELSDRGLATVEAGRRARVRIGADLAAVLGPERTAAFTESIRIVSDRTDAVVTMAGRRLRPEQAR